MHIGRKWRGNSKSYSIREGFEGVFNKAIRLIFKKWLDHQVLKSIECCKW